MSLNITKVADNILSVTPVDEYDQNWIKQFQPIAHEIFNPNTAMIIAAKWELKDILTNDAAEFRQLLEDTSKFEYLREKHHFMRYEFIHKKIKWILTSLYNVPKDVIDDLIESGEFNWAGSYLICCQGVLDTFSDELIADIKEVIDKGTFLEMPKIKCELLAITDHEEELLWFNPVLNIE